MLREESGTAQTVRTQVFEGKAPAVDIGRSALDAAPLADNHSVTHTSGDAAAALGCHYLMAVSTAPWQHPCPDVQISRSSLAVG
jgi:hypothetical protein